MPFDAVREDADVPCSGLRDAVSDVAGELLDRVVSDVAGAEVLLDLEDGGADLDVDASALPTGASRITSSRSPSRRFSPADSSSIRRSDCMFASARFAERAESRAATSARSTTTVDIPLTLPSHPHAPAVLRPSARRRYPSRTHPEGPGANQRQARSAVVGAPKLSRKVTYRCSRFATHPRWPDSGGVTTF